MYRPTGPRAGPQPHSLPLAHGPKSVLRPSIKTSAERVVLLKRTASVTTPPLCESTRYLRRILRDMWKVQKENYGKRKIRPRNVMGAFPYLSLLYTVSISISATLRTLGGSTRGVPLVPETIGTMLAIPDVPPSAGDTHRGVVVGEQGSGR